MFADLVSLRSISISFHNLGNIADEKLSRFLFKPRSNLYDFFLFRSAIRGLKKKNREGYIKVSMHKCQNTKFVCIIKIKNFQFWKYWNWMCLESTILNRSDCLFCNDLIFCSLEFLAPHQVTIQYSIWGLTREL